jgi:hypothetical protein
VVFRKQCFNLNCCFSATSNRPGSSGVRSNDYMDLKKKIRIHLVLLHLPIQELWRLLPNIVVIIFFFVVFRKHFFNTVMIIKIIFSIFYLDDGIVNQFRQNEAGNRRPKVTSIPFGRILVV